MEYVRNGIKQTHLANFVEMVGCVHKLNDIILLRFTVEKSKAMFRRQKLMDMDIDQRLIVYIIHVAYSQ